MKIICTSIKGVDNITIGKEYSKKEIIEIWYLSESPPTKSISYYIINDVGCAIYCSKELFITLDEYRDKKLEELGIITEK